VKVFAGKKKQRKMEKYIKSQALETIIIRGKIEMKLPTLLPILDVFSTNTTRKI
jgi:hypothetical protein